MDNRLRRLARRRVPDADPAPARRRQPDLGYVFIVTYGRSGSTLLMGVLNSLPGYLIRGENRDAIYHLFKFHATCAAERTRHRRGLAKDGSNENSANPFFGIGGYRGGKAIAAIRQLIIDTLLRPQPDTRVTGFKEIRWHKPDLADYVAFLQQVFPGAKFVVNTRNHADVAKSDWWGEMDDAIETLAEIEGQLLAVAEQLGEAAYHVHYDDYVADPGVLQGLIEWLGEEYDADRIAGVLGLRHNAG